MGYSPLVPVLCWGHPRVLYTALLILKFFISELSQLEDESLHGLKIALNVFDYCVLTVFVLEIIVKWIDGFWSFWSNGWNVFDFFVTIMVLDVATSLIGNFIPFVTLLCSSSLLFQRS